MKKIIVICLVLFVLGAVGAFANQQQRNMCDALGRESINPGNTLDQREAARGAWEAFCVPPPPAGN